MPSVSQLLFRPVLKTQRGTQCTLLNIQISDSGSCCVRTVNEISQESGNCIFPFWLFFSPNTVKDVCMCRIPSLKFRLGWSMKLWCPDARLCFLYLEISPVSTTRLCPMASVTPVLWRALRDQRCFCRNWLSSSQSISHNSFLMDNTIFFLCGWTYHVTLNLSLPRYIWFYTRTESWFCYCNHNLSSITMIIKPSHIEAYVSLIPSLPGEVPSSPIALSNTLQSNFSSEYLCTNREFWGALCSISMSQHLADGSRVPKGWEYVLSHYSAHTLKTQPLSYCLALLIYICICISSYSLFFPCHW